MTRVALTAVLLVHLTAAAPARLTGRVVDAVTGAAIAGASLTIGTHVIQSGPDGSFAVDAANAGLLRARAPGYLRVDVPFQAGPARDIVVRLTPFRPKALYLTVYGIGSKQLRTDALNLIDNTELNALVIDVKGDRGLIPYPSGIALAAEVGAQRVRTIPDLAVLAADLHARHIYLIARIVVFKDDLLAAGRPALAVRRGGAIYRDREGLAWANPYSADVWNYNIAIAVEAARAGFDEIQFDYVRLPDATGLTLERPWTEDNRVAAIDGFLSAARAALVPYNVFLAADVFGYVAWNADDTHIGQKVGHIAGIVDYVSPMLYPSSFQFGIPGYRNPVEHPYEIVRRSLEEAQKRARVAPIRFRPWLQAFRDYAFGGRPFTAGEVRRQIDAAETFGADGWMLWNPRNRYSAADVKPSDDY